MKTITITLDGGVIRAVDDIPFGICLRLINFQVDGPDNLPLENGQRAKVTEYTGKLAPAQRSTRNTPLLGAITNLLGADHRLGELEQYFRDDYLLIAGNTQTVADAAEKLRLAITTEECGLVLDYIAQNAMAGITIDHVEDAINALFPDRFIEP